MKESVMLVTCVAVALIALIVVGGLVFPPGDRFPGELRYQDIPSGNLREQLEEQERIRERYEGDFYEPVKPVKTPRA